MSVCGIWFSFASSQSLFNHLLTCLSLFNAYGLEWEVRELSFAETKQHIKLMLWQTRAALAPKRWLVAAIRNKKWSLHIYYAKWRSLFYTTVSELCSWSILFVSTVEQPWLPPSKLQRRSMHVKDHWVYSSFGSCKSVFWIDLSARKNQRHFAFLNYRLFTL